MATAQTLKPTFSKLTFIEPVFLTHSPHHKGWLFVVERGGLVKTFENKPSVSSAKVFFDARSLILAEGNEEGLLGLAFDPQNSKKLYAYYTAANPRRIVLASFRYYKDRVDLKSREVLFEDTKKWPNHNGGMLAFGPDKMLYVAVGDRGYGNDPDRNGQNLATLWGKILRIDVQKKESGKNYAIPSDNPFVKRPQARSEIWAYGLRNPWRFSFDRKTGDLWAADVGQDEWEEVNLIKRGGNYGWSVFEGFKNFMSTPIPKDQIFEKPLVVYPHPEWISITGGYVYRGSKIPAIQGHYLHGDYGSGEVYALDFDFKAYKPRANHLIGKVPELSSFGEDEQGELYALSLSSGKLWALK